MVVFASCGGGAGRVPMWPTPARIFDRINQYFLSQKRRYLWPEIRLVNMSVRPVANIAVQFLLSALVPSLWLSGCEFTELSQTCPAGVGVQVQAYNGAALDAKQLVLTFDGGPSDGTAAIDAALFANGIQGTFFVSGHNVVGRETVLATLKAHGHLVANFAYSDTPIEYARDPEREVRKADALIRPYITGNMFLLRSPGGANLTAEVVEQLNKAGFSRYVGPIGWDIGDQNSGLVSDRDCWRAGKSASDCAAGYLNAVKSKDHGIVLLHGEDARTAQLLQTLLPQLKELNYTFVRLDSVSQVQTALKAASAKTGVVGGAAGCSDY